MLTVQGHNYEVDYWAFGVFLYEMAIGCASFNVEADGTMNHEMPPFRVRSRALASAARCASARSPERRTAARATRVRAPPNRAALCLPACLPPCLRRAAA